MLSSVSKTLARVVHMTRLVSRASAWVLGALLLATIVLVGSEILTRQLFGFSFKFVHEYAGYLLAFLSSWGLAHALLERSHIRIDIVYHKCPDKLKRILDILSIGSLAAVAFLIAYLGFPVLERSIVNGSLANTTMATPLWIPHLIWFTGYLWFLFVCVVLFLRTTVMAFEEGLSQQDFNLSADFSDEVD